MKCICKQNSEIETIIKPCDAPFHNCICKHQVILEIEDLVLTQCLASCHKCICPYKSFTNVCLAGKTNCNQHQIKPKKCKCNRKKSHVYCLLGENDKEKHVCICFEHYLGFLLSRPCRSIHHNTCLCYYQKCVANDTEVNHICICYNNYNHFVKCRHQYDDHKCICFFNNPSVCKSSTHYCSCNVHGTVSCRSATTTHHHCSCHINVFKCLNVSFAHKCICNSSNQKLCKASFYSHQCICKINFDLETIYENTDVCRHSLHYSELCICNMGRPFIKRCIGPLHICTCKYADNNSNNTFPSCRSDRHKNSYEIWNLWESTNSFIYWISEEVLMDILRIYLLNLSNQNYHFSFY